MLMPSVDVQFGSTQCCDMHFDNHIGRVPTDWNRASFDSNLSYTFEYHRLHSLSICRHLELRFSIEYSTDKANEYPMIIVIRQKTVICDLYAVNK